MLQPLQLARVSLKGGISRVTEVVIFVLLHANQRKRERESGVAKKTRPFLISL